MERTASLAPATSRSVLSWRRPYPAAARPPAPLLRLDAGRLPRRRSRSSAWTPVVYLNVGRRRYSARCSSAESPPAKLRVLVPAESPIGDAPSPARRVAVRSPSRAAHSRSSACSPLPSRLPALLLRRPAESPAPLPARCRPARRGELLRRPAPPSGLSSGGSGDGECCGGGSGDGEGCGDGSGLSLSAADLADAVVAEPRLLAVKADTIARRRSAAPSCLAARRISVVEREVRAEAEVAMVIANGVVSGCKRERRDDAARALTLLALRRRRRAHRRRRRQARQRRWRQARATTADSTAAVGDRLGSGGVRGLGGAGSCGGEGGGAGSDNGEGSGGGRWLERRAADPTMGRAALTEDGSGDGGDKLGSGGVEGLGGTGSCGGEGGGGGSDDGEGCADGSGGGPAPWLLRAKVDAITRRIASLRDRSSVAEIQVRAEVAAAMVVANGVVSGGKRRPSHPSLVPSTKQKTGIVLFYKPNTQ
uniref:Uncharacterized protein n=1 Tax=Oryza rufipogon TaxID=4529 RepID=A0A0E0Q575_ORYRU